MKKNIKRVICLLVSLFCFVCVFSEDIVLEQGILKLVLHEYSGTFSLYKKNTQTGKYVSLIDNSYDGATSGFYLKLGNKKIKLTRVAGVEIATESLMNGAQLIYTVKNEAIVKVSFTLLKSIIDGEYDSLKIQMSTQNISSNSKNMAMKVVFDTVLGEVGGNHFMTKQNKSVSTETFFTDMTALRWIRSANQTDSVQFLISGDGVSNPEFVVLGSRDTVLAESWIPPYKIGRSFDSIQTYGNSAIGICWRDVMLSPLSVGTFSFYVTTGSNGRNPAEIKVFETGVLQEEIVVKEDESVQYTDSYGTTYTIGALTQAQLDPEYVSALLEKIHNLEILADKSNRDEIQKLNAELDAIMQKLGW